MYGEPTACVLLLSQATRPCSPDTAMVGLPTNLPGSRPACLVAGPCPAVRATGNSASNDVGRIAFASDRPCSAAESPRQPYGAGGSQQHLPQPAAGRGDPSQEHRTQASAEAHQPPIAAFSSVVTWSSSCASSWGDPADDADWTITRQLVADELAHMHQRGFAPGVDAETLQVMKRQPLAQLAGAAARSAAAASTNPSRSMYSGAGHAVGRQPVTWHRERANEVCAPGGHLHGICAWIIAMQ